MLAYNGEYDPAKLRYPLLVSQKFDGVRLFKWKGKWITRSKKDSINPNIMAELDRMNIQPDGIDCELLYGKSFHEGQSIIRSKTASIDNLPEPVVLVVHDYMVDGFSFGVRWARLASLNYKTPLTIYQKSNIIMIVNVPQIWVQKPEDIKSYLIGLGGPEKVEGLMLRSPYAMYKHGRSTLAEQALIKYVPYVEEEATIVGFEELVRMAKRGTSRLKHQIKAGILGSFIVESEKWGKFKLSGKLSNIERTYIWGLSHTFKGKVVKFKYKPFGFKDKPRCPIFIGFKEPVKVTV